MTALNPQSSYTIPTPSHNLTTINNAPSFYSEENLAARVDSAVRDLLINNKPYCFIPCFDPDELRDLTTDLTPQTLERLPRLRPEIGTDDFSEQLPEAYKPIRPIIDRINQAIKKALGNKLIGAPISILPYKKGVPELNFSWHVDSAPPRSFPSGIEQLLPGVKFLRANLLLFDGGDRSHTTQFIGLPAELRPHNDMLSLSNAGSFGFPIERPLPGELALFQIGDENSHSAIHRTPEEHDASKTARLLVAFDIALRTPGEA